MNLTTPDFDFLRQMVLTESGIVLESGKEYLVETRLAPVIRKRDIEDFSALVAELRTRPSRDLRAAIVDAMTTNETSFFRDTHPWESLRTEILPALIESRSGVRSLNFWCAAASSGQEPYTLAMLIHEYFPEVAQNWRVRIMGTDLSPTMVERARNGRFSQLEVNRGLPARMLMTYFDRQGADWVVKDHIRKMTDFRIGNLTDQDPAHNIPLVDAVFIRNVLIYFDTATRRRILQGIHGRLRSDGFLMLGSSETTSGLDALYQRDHVGRTVLFRPIAHARSASLVGTR